MNTHLYLIPLRFLGLLTALLPVSVSAADLPLGFETNVSMEAGSVSLAVLLFSVAIIITLFLVRVWVGVLNVSTVYNTQSLAAVEKKHPYLPDISVIMGAIIVTAALIVLSADTFSKVLPLNALFGSSNLVHRIVTVLLAFAAFGVFDRSRFHARREQHPLLFAFIMGTIVTWVLIGFSFAFFQTGVKQDPFLLALGITCVITGWRFLFGPWSARIKATVLATFIFWVTYTLLQQKTHEEMLATGLAAIVAFIPVALWCKLFLSYHKERLSYVLLAFFSGILSIVPILFYDALVRHSIEFDFFLFKIVPINFSASSQNFVQQSVFSSVTGVQSTILVTLVTYIVVGLIEEVSKFWVLKHSGESFFASVNDVLQLAIIVAIGFAFGENLMNPNYFVGFVLQYLIHPSTPEWGQFIGNVFGRSVLTNMVHILSTGIMGFFFAQAFFASPLLKAEYANGKRHPAIQWLHQVLAMKPDTIFEREMMIQGLFLAIGLHAAFDFIVSLPSVLPGNPSTIGELLGSADGSFLSNISIILLPSILYIVGGVWLLLWLLSKDSAQKQFGQRVQSQTFITASPVIPAPPPLTNS